MKKVVAIVVSILFVLSVTSLCFAAEEKMPAAPAEKKEAAAPEKAAKKHSKKQVTGEVAAVDAAAMTLTVKGKKGEVALSADDKTKVMMGKEKKPLADVKVGEKVTVKYMVADGKNMAKTITIRTAAAGKKEAKPAEKEMKPAEKK
jgi:surface antigen